MTRRGKLLALWLCTASWSMARPVEFNRDVRPILSDNCFQCHGPDKGQRKADLRLDDRANAIAKEAIVPGKPNDSELIRRIVSDDATEVMPPPTAHKKLTAVKKETLKRWIADGA
ncbi:MAG: c-type cytochrome domain-containing protein [Gemmataceae bacterium]